MLACSMDNSLFFSDTPGGGVEEMLLFLKSTRIGFSLILCMSYFQAYASSCNESQQLNLISPCNYLQNPFGLTGLSTKAGKDGTYNIGIAALYNENIMSQLNNKYGFGYATEIWGQTSKWRGFAIGGAVILANFGSANLLNPTDKAAQMATHVTPIAILSQAYLSYQYQNYLDVNAGNIILNTPWVTSLTSTPPYLLNSTFQGATANIQLLPNLLINAFGIVSYQNYPNNFWTRTTNYNEPGSVISSINNTPTPGALGIGAKYQPIKTNTLNLWFYQFYNYIDMWYADNDFKLNLSKNVSMNFGIQGVMQTANGSNLVGQQTLIGTKLPAGTPNGNAIGLKLDINVPHDTVSFSYNNVFGPVGSFLNGGLLTPYTYLFEADPLYTTPGLTSIAELGSGSAFTLKNKMSFLDNSFNTTLSYSAFFVNTVYPTQANHLEEYDAIMTYNVPHTKLSILGRLIYLQQPGNAGGNILQPRLVIGYVF
jgi:hypothetical protein